MLILYILLIMVVLIIIKKSNILNLNILDNVLFSCNNSFWMPYNLLEFDDEVNYEKNSI